MRSVLGIALMICCVYTTNAVAVVSSPIEPVVKETAVLTSPTEGAVVGYVIDKQGSIPIVGATIQVLGTRRGAYSTANGVFRLYGLKSGDYKLRISSLGYQADTVNVTIVEGNTTEIEAKLYAKASSEIFVSTEAVSGQGRALNQQRSAPNITNVVSSDQIGRFPDANVGDALKRVTGIAVQYDQGEARFGLIRGTASRLNSVTVNGERVPSAEAETRSIQLDLVPSDMVQAIEVNKSVMPDMDADAIGGSVNLVTRTSAGGQRVTATLGSGVNLLTDKPMLTGAITASDRFLDNKLGLVVSGSYYDHILGSDNIEGGWSQGDNGVFLEEFETRRYDIRRIRRSLSASLDYRLSSDHMLYVNGLYNHRDDWENRYAVGYEFSEGDSSATIVREHKAGKMDAANNGARLEDQRMSNITLGGDHLFAERIRLTWSGTYSSASEERPHERHMEWENESGRAVVSISDSTIPSITMLDNSDAPSNYELGALSEEYSFTEDVDRNGRFDVNIPFITEGDRNSLKVGGRIRTKKKSRSNTFTEYAPTDANAGFSTMNEQPLFDYSREGFLAGPYQIGQLVSKEAVGSYDVNNSALWEASDEPSEYIPANFTATETILGGYAMWTQNIGSDLTLIGGLRFENTANDYSGNQWDEDSSTFTPVTVTSTYMNVLPGLHARYAVNPDLILRAAWTNTLSRPNYYDLVPYRIINREDGELQEGNPELKATTAMNFDIMAEKYFESVGIISAGVFHKRLNNFIFTYLQDDYADAVTGETFDSYNQQRNGGSATILGFEVAIQRRLDFLPSFLQNLGIYANYTYTTSTAEGMGIPGREGEKLELAGTANNTFNAALSYEGDGLMARIAANYTSAYVDEYADNAFDDRYYDAQLFVDASVSYRITRQLRIFVEANNLTNQPLRYYQGSVNRVAQAEFYNSRITSGLKFDL